MTADLLDDLLADLIGTTSSAGSASSAAKGANPANAEDVRGSAPDSPACVDARKPANPVAAETPFDASSQEFAVDRKTADPVETEQQQRSSPSSPDSQGQVVRLPSQGCANCANFGRAKTCLDPVAAGLVARFEICWPPDGHGRQCVAWRPQPSLPTSSGPHEMTVVQSDRCHEGGWDDDEIAMFCLRRDRIMRRGYVEAKAEAIAERLTLRDRDNDDRRMCIECTQLSYSGRCLAAAAGRLWQTGRNLEPVANILQRCEGFAHGTGFAAEVLDVVARS